MKRAISRHDFVERTRQMFDGMRRDYRKVVDDVGAEMLFSLGVFRVAIEQLFDSGAHCPYCEEMLTIKNISTDHKIPTSRAAEFVDLLNKFGISCDSITADAAAFDFANLQFVCKRCNKRKGDLTFHEYASLVSFIENHFPKKARTYIFTKLSSTPFRWWSKHKENKDVSSKAEKVSAVSQNKLFTRDRNAADDRW